MIMKEKWQHIIDSSSCPPVADLELYFYGKLPEEKRIGLENHLADCELCNDYLDGLAELPGDGSLDEAESDLKQAVQALLEKQARNPIVFFTYKRIAFAASVILLIGCSLFFFFYSQDKPVQLAEGSKQETEAPVQPDLFSDSEPVTKNQEFDSLKEEIVKEPVLLARKEASIKSDVNKKEPGVEELVSELSTKSPERVEITAGMAVENPEPPVRKTMALAKEKTRHIDGVVRDEKGQPVFGAAIQITNRTEGGISMEDGSFGIAVRPGDSLRISFIGYETVIIPADTNGLISVTLPESNLALNEVVVVGSAVERQKSLTGAVVAKKVEISEMKKYSLREKHELKQLSRNYKAMSDTVKDEWYSARYKAQYYLILEDDRAVDYLDQLFDLTEKVQKLDSIRQAIDFAEQDRYTEARRIIDRLQK